MISVITPTFNTKPEILARTWASLKNQTFTDWEWVIWDDSTRPETWAQIYGFASDERYKVVVHRSHVHSGVIGQVKRRAFMVAEGDILVELDHDDELTPDCLQNIFEAFNDSSVGFVFSNWCELNEMGESCRYPEGWAFGYGSDYWDDVHKVWVMRSPEVNRTTLSHIVSVPNHVRAWRAAVYRILGGHNERLPVADDYELLVRTLVSVKWCHVDKLLYKQHINSGTAQRERNDLIQSLVADISGHYSSVLDERFKS